MTQAPAVATVQARVDPSVGDSDVRPSGAELLRDAAFSLGSNLDDLHRRERNEAIYVDAIRNWFSKTERV